VCEFIIVYPLIRKIIVHMMSEEEIAVVEGVLKQDNKLKNYD
jgi:hypothetical protein